MCALSNPGSRASQGVVDIKLHAMSQPVAFECFVVQRLQDHTCRYDNLSEVLGSPFHKALAYTLQPKGIGLSDRESSLLVALMEELQSRKY